METRSLCTHGRVRSMPKANQGANDKRIHVGDANFVFDGTVRNGPETTSTSLSELCNPEFPRRAHFLGWSVLEGRTYQALPRIWKELIVTEWSVYIHFSRLYLLISGMGQGPSPSLHRGVN